MSRDTRGEFAISRGRGPVIHRKIGSRIIEEPLGRPTDELDTLNELLAGVTQADLQGPKARWHASMVHQGAPGSGPSPNDGYIERKNNYDNPGGQDLTSIPDGYLHSEISEDERAGKARIRKEVGDFAQEQPENFSGFTDQEDLWSMDLLEDLQDREREKGHGKPAFASLEDEVDNIFSVDENG